MIGKLLINEFSKLWHQWSWRIMVLLMLVFSALYVPFLNSLKPDYNYDSDYPYYKNLYEEEKNADVKELLKTVMEDYKLLEDNDISRNSWRINFFWQYREYHATLTALNLIKNGADMKAMTEGLEQYTLISTKESSIGGDGFKDQFEIPVDIVESVGGMQYETVPFNIEDIDKYIDEMKTLYERGRARLLSGTAEFAEIQIAAMKENIEIEKNNLKQNDGDITETESSQNKIAIYEAAIKCYESFKTCQKEDEEWVVGEIDDYLLGRLISSGLYKAAAKSKDSFINNKGGYSIYFQSQYDPYISFGTYEEYTEFLKTVKADFKTALDMIVYSVEHRIPLSEYGENDIVPKNAFRQANTANVFVVMFFVIFLCSTIMANEYTSGSVRLLLVRPCARWKILLSKLLCVMIFGGVMLFVTYGISYLSALIAYGAKALSLPDIIAQAGKIVEVPFMANVLYNGFLSFLGMFGVAMLAFMLSLIIKRGIAAAAAGILLYSFGSVAGALIQYLLNKAPFLKLTVLPYLMRLSDLNYSVVSRFVEYEPVTADYGLALSMGVGITLLHIAVFIVLSFVVFDKQQIKN